MRNKPFLVVAYGVAMSSSSTIHEFQISIPEGDLQDLRDRLGRTRWPGTSANGGWERGVPLDYLQHLASYWRDRFDWRAQEADLNRFPQFLATIDGQRIHFLHIRSAEPEALPLIITHGYPAP